MSRFISGRITVAIALLAALAAGCQNTGQNTGQAKEGKAVVASMKETHDYLGKAATELDGTRALLDRLSTETDLKAWKTEYDKTVAKMQTAAGRARDQWFDMKHNSVAYIEKWDQEISETQSPEVKEGMEARRQRVGAALDGVVLNAQELREAYQPYILDLTELQKALMIDLTPAGVKALQPAIDKAKADGDVVAKKLDVLGKQLDKLAGRLSPTTNKT